MVAALALADGSRAGPLPAQVASYSDAKLQVAPALLDSVAAFVAGVAGSASRWSAH